MKTDISINNIVTISEGIWLTDGTEVLLILKQLVNYYGKRKKHFAGRLP